MSEGRERAGLIRRALVFTRHVFGNKAHFEEDKQGAHGSPMTPVAQSAPEMSRGANAARPSENRKWPAPLSGGNGPPCGRRGRPVASGWAASGWQTQKALAKKGPLPTSASPASCFAKLSSHGLESPPRPPPGSGERYRCCLTSHLNTELGLWDVTWRDRGGRDDGGGL